MHLTQMKPAYAHTGYGKLGLRGELGYEGKRVRVGGRHYDHAISAHPPSRVRFALDGRYQSLRCRVALNDDVPGGASHATFTVFADGRLMASAHHVAAGEPPHEIFADVRGAATVELDVSTSRWNHCHAVWIDPELDESPLTESAGQTGFPLLDCLARAEVPAPVAGARTSRCIATVVSPKYSELVDDLLGSLRANGGCHDAKVVVFGLDADEGCARAVAKYGATFIPCRSHARINATSKALLYSVARIVDADQYLCLDADMLVLGDLGPIFAALETMPPGTILACREGNGFGLHDLGQSFRDTYSGSEDDARLLQLTDEEKRYPLVVNDGLFAGSREALLALDGSIRGLRNAVTWVDRRHDNWWRNQFIFNLTLARLGCGVRLDDGWNLQLHTQDVTWRTIDGRPRALWHERPVRVLHFSGSGRRKHPEQKKHYARVPDPLPGTGGGDLYTVFTEALRAWIGRHGVSAMTWSFYGLTDGQHARVADPSTFPLLALLHYLVRSNGCTRVVEVGTASGVSAACLASAVAHREGARVVTFDIAAPPRREELWSLLPPRIRGCIEARMQGSHEGLADAVAAGERYEAALLDSVHTEAHVWREFELAAELVCPGGLILIHDAIYAHGTVGAALERIEAAGYGVTRLWTAEAGEREDDRLGLAVIENRRRPRR